MKSSKILNGFVNHNIREVAKSVQISAIDSTKYDLFTPNQVKKFMHNSAVKAEGLGIELQKGIICNVKAEIDNLISVSVLHRGKKSTFYLSKTGVCTELLKAVTPVNQNEYFISENVDKDKVLAFIDEQGDKGVDEDTLIDTFGEEVLDILNELEEEGEIEVDEEGFYFVKEVPSKENNEGEKKEEKSEGELESPKEEEEQEKKDGGKTEEINTNTEEEGINNKETEENKEDNPLESKIKDKEETPSDEEEVLKESTEEESTEEEPTEEKKDKELGDSLSPEELEEFAKKTASVTLLKFYKNSNDEKLKEIAALELKSRGINPNEDNSPLPNETPTKNDDIIKSDSQELNALEDFIKEYLSEYDKEDLVKYVVELANENPAKRKELKDLYRKYYSLNNAGNQALKIDEEEFKIFLTDHYFNNLTIGDLQSYAFLMISKNAKEYKKYKRMIEEKENM